MVTRNFFEENIRPYKPHKHKKVGMHKAFRPKKSESKLPTWCNQDSDEDSYLGSTLRKE